MIAKYVEKLLGGGRPGHDRRRAPEAAAPAPRAGHVERAVADIAAGRAVVRRRRRRPGERGRHHLRREQGDPRADGVHDPAHQRRDLRADAGPGTRPAPAAADDHAEQGAHADRVHRQRGRPGRGHAPGSRRPTGPGRSGSWWTRPPSPTSWSGPATSSRCATPRAACCAGPGTPRRRSTWPGWPGWHPAGVLAEVVNDDGSMARLPALRAFADEHGLALISIAQLIEYRRHSERMVRRVVETRLPNALRRMAGARLPELGRRDRARRPGLRRPRRRRARSWSGCTPSA